MIKGIDIGNSITKDEKGYSFASKVTRIGNILGNKFNFEFREECYVVNEGDYDTTYRKVKKVNYLKLLFSILSISESEGAVNLMLGLPLSQYRNDRENLKKLIENNSVLKGKYNGINKFFVIEDVEVYPEGIASLPFGYEGVIVDIGGLTTDCCMVTNINNKRSIEKPISISKGTLNLYSDFINLINNKYGLNLTNKDAERILRTGLKIKGENQDISFAINIFKEYLEKLITDLNLQYSLETNNIVFTGGGSLLLKKPILNRLPYAVLEEDAIFSNARGFYREGCKIWQRD